MKKLTLIVAFAIVAATSLSACIVAPVTPSGTTVAPVAPPPGTVYVAPPYPAPAVGFMWLWHPEIGWGWYHPQRGWHRR
jgi:hypothetical protein